MPTWVTASASSPYPYECIASVCELRGAVMVCIRIHRSGEHVRKRGVLLEKG
jgi:hypothetical protein